MINYLLCVYNKLDVKKEKKFVLQKGNKASLVVLQIAIKLVRSFFLLFAIERKNIAKMLR